MVCIYLADNQDAAVLGVELSRFFTSLSSFYPRSPPHGEEKLGFQEDLFTDPRTDLEKRASWGLHRLR